MRSLPPLETEKFSRCKSRAPRLPWLRTITGFAPASLALASACKFKHISQEDQVEQSLIEEVLVHAFSEKRTQESIQRQTCSTIVSLQKLDFEVH